MTGSFISKLVDHLVLYTFLNFNIMDGTGLILGSSDNLRVGTYSEAIQRMGTKLPDTISATEENELDTTRSVLLPIKYNEQQVGIIEVFGESVASILPIASTIKLAIETIFDCDSFQRSHSSKSLERYFVDCFLYENATKNELINLARQLNYLPNQVRVAITFRPDDAAVVDMDIQNLKKYPCFLPQDIVSATRDGHIVIFKSFPLSEKEFIPMYRNEITEFLKDLPATFPGIRASTKFFVGSPQDNLFHYKSSYLHCVWLETNITSDDTIVFFYDYPDYYLRSRIPYFEMHRAFSIFEKNWSEAFIEGYMETVGTLLKNNYNLVQASKALYVHKNTLVSRMDRIKLELNMNPFQNLHDRKFMNYLYYYFRERKMQRF